MTVSVRKIESLAQLKTLEKPWADCLSRCSYRNLFLTHHWVVCWWTHFGAGHDLSVLLIEDGSELIGIAPMMITRSMYSGLPVRMLGLMMNKHTSRADFITPDERRQEVLGALVRYWESHADDWDVLRLFHVPQESGTMGVLQSGLQRSRLSVFPIEESRRLLYLPLSGSWEDYLGRQSRNFRKNIRRCWEKARASGEIEVICRSGDTDAEPNMNELFSLQAATWKAASPEACMTSEDQAFQLDLVRSPSSRSRYVNYLMRLNGQSIAGIHLLFYQRVCYPILLYCDERYAELSPGRCLIAHVIKVALENHESEEIDFNGSSEFLGTWTGTFRVAESVSVCHERLYSRLVSSLKRLKRQLAWAEVSS